MYIAIDMGGTKTRVASTKNLSEIYKSEKFLTQGNLEDQKHKIESAIVQVSDNQILDGIAFGFPGIIDHSEKRFKKVPNYKSLENLTFDYFFKDSFNSVPLFVQNDAALAGLGEALRGSGKGYKTVAYLTLGTGVGGVKIENGTIPVLQKFYEPGHMVINFNGNDVDGAGIKGSLESFVSGKSFSTVYGINPENCDDEDIWNDYADKLSYGITNVVVMWNPDVIVLGGSMALKLDMFEKRLLANVDLLSSFEIPEIKKAVLLDDAGIYGGFDYLSQNLVKFIRA